MKAEIRITSLIIVPLLALAGTLAPNASVHADYYKYKDSKGTICITNKLDSVPNKYRSTMKVIREEKTRRVDRESQPALPSAVAPATPEQSSSRGGVQSAAPSQVDSSADGLAVRFPWVKAVLVVLGLAAALLTVAKLTSMISSPQLSRLISIVFFAGLFLFTYKVYADHLVDGYFTIKTKILKMFANANAREAPEGGIPARNPEGKPLK